MASTGKSNQSTKTKVRRLRAPSETVRDLGQGGNTAKSTGKGRIRSFFGRIGALKFWRPFKVVLRFLAKYTVPPYFRNSLKELKMVTWPNRKETRQLTFAVILFSILFGVLIAIVDYGLDKLFKKVILQI